MMDNRILYGIMVLIFNCVGVPCFMRGETSVGVKRIVFGIISFGVIMVINEIKGIILGIKILQMTDEEYNEKKGNISMGVPR